MPNVRDVIKPALVAYRAYRTPQSERTMKQRLYLISIYTMVEFGARLFLRLASTIILTRLLEPSAFGVYAVVGMVLMIISTFTDVGFRPIALSREAGLDDTFIQSLHTVRMMRGVFLFFVMLLASFGVFTLQGADYFFADSAYADPELPWLMLAISTTLIIDSLSTSNALYADKKLEYDRIFYFNLFFTIITGIFPIIFVYMTGSIWGLVISSIALSCLRSALTWVYFKGAPFRIRVIRDDIIMFIQRGKWILSQTLLNTVGSVADKVLFGLMFTDERFGFYYLATQIAMIVESIVKNFQTKIGIQVFTSLSEGSVEEFRRKYYRLRLPVDMVSMLSSGFIAAFAPAIIDIIYEDRYAEVADFIQVLAFAAVLIGPCMLRQALIATREFKLGTKIVFIRVICFWAALAFAIVYLESVEVAIWVVVLQLLPDTIILLVIGYRRGWVSIPMELRTTPFLALGYAAGYGAAMGYDRLASAM